MGRVPPDAAEKESFSCGLGLRNMSSRLTPWFALVRVALGARVASSCRNVAETIVALRGTGTWHVCSALLRSVRYRETHSSRHLRRGGSLEPR